MVALPAVSVNINGFSVSDALVDTGSQVCLIDSRVFSVVAPNAELSPPARLLSASGHCLNALGTCRLTVERAGDSDCARETEFIVVHNLMHDVVLGWDFLSANHVVLNCSPKHTAKIKLRLKKPVNVPPHSAVCMAVKVDQPLPEGEYLFVGQCTSNVEVSDSLLTPFSETEIPVYIRNRSDRSITVHRRSVIGYAESVDHVETCDGEPAASDAATVTGDGTAEVNAVSADDGRFVGKATQEILSEFVVGEPISGSQRDKLASLLSSFPEVFSRGYADIGKYQGDDVDLELQSGARPQFAKPYPVPWAREDQLRSQLEELQACGVLEEGEPSDWNSPIILIPKGPKGSKGSNEYRIVQDLRGLNKLLVPKQFVFPTIDEFIFSLHGWKVASSLDIRHAFWNLQLSQDSSKFCAFYALGKTYYPRRMPMGCMQSSYFLHLVMRKVLGDLEGVHCYADDILLTSDSLENHYQLLHQVLTRLRFAGLKIAPEKCRLFQTKLNYLGHRITPDGVCMDPDRIQVISDMPNPRSVKEAKRAFGFFSWFRKFVPSFSQISEPLVVLCNSEKYYWNEELDNCFRRLKDEMIGARVLSYPRRDLPFVLYTDSSTTGSGQILCQVQDGQERVIAFAGSRYSRAQRKWTIFELEVFSFIQGLKKFYKYLADVDFSWICDCRSALQILHNKDHINPRLVRWRALVSQFRFTTEHRRASQMQHVDMLSRLHESAGDTEADCQVPRDDSSGGAGLSPRCSTPASQPSRDGRGRPGELAVTGAAGQISGAGAPGGGPRSLLRRPPGRPPEPVSSGRAAATAAPAPAADVQVDAPAEGAVDGQVDVEASRLDQEVSEGAREVNLTAADFLVQQTLKPESLVWYQKHDRNCRAIVHRLNHGKWPRFANRALRREPVEDFALKGDILIRKCPGSEGEAVIVWPTAKRFELMYNHHDVTDGAHGSGVKMYEVLRRYVWYPGLKRDCEDYVRSCRRCSSRKSTQQQHPPLLPQEASYPNETLVIDIVSLPRSTSSGRYQLLTCVDKFTGHLTCYPLDSASADHIIDKLSFHFMTFGPPETMESDAGSNLLKNANVKVLCDYFGIQVRFSVGYHHEAVGKVERRHLDIKRRLRALSESHGADWELLLPGIVFALNNEVCSTHGFSPFFLYFLRYPHSPLSHLIDRPVSKYSDNYVHEKLRMLSDVLRRAHKQQSESMRGYKQQYDRRHRARDPTLRPGDQIWLKNFDASAKMDDPWVGPYIVESCVGRRHVNYIDRKGTVRRTHVKNVKRVCERSV